MYKPSITAKKGTFEGLIIGLIATGSAKLATIAQANGINISQDWIMAGLTAIGAGIYKAVVNWYKNRKRGKE